ncbi:NAD(P)-dependent alcohol dehydrogenase [Bifidobacterium sp. ESL0682]|uniref:NAD(P)-dependent alcohol dehydrogenase n=1 Tax=Bifidobacterium sp. ESL0682 TaxID=2983212 RepID=UPI0023F9D0F7|nr:NAD(P)-dependent alcohol dehydrogenase [Bifidobacterium sp. ESL0682]WEV41816.1 NAD(P)-dependent alcohol dehydrogenase [Bifidobacterium sp. ESL0682]
MKGIVYTQFGAPKEALHVEEVDKPTIEDNQVLVNVKASSLNLADYMRFIEPVMGKEMSPMMRNMDENVIHALGKVLGVDVAGVVEEVGNKVTDVKPGDEVFGATPMLIGAWAEYTVINDGDLYLKPTNLSFEEAATLPAAAQVALSEVRLADIKPGQNVLVNGATGGVGLFTLQIAKAFGATVTAVCSTHNVDLVRSFGADKVIDYTKEDFTKSSDRYDCILAVNGYATLEQYRDLLADGGVYVPVGGMQQTGEANQRGKECFEGTGKSLRSIGFAQMKKEYPYIKELAENKAITPVIDRTFAITDIAEAIEFAVNHHPQGKIALSYNF